MQMYIPRPGDLIRLSRDWYFTLHAEYRNSSLFDKMGANSYDVGGYTYRGYQTLQTFIEVGTILRVDRIYIKKNAPNFDSVTFWVKSGPYSGARFWAKLNDVNNMEFEKAYESDVPLRRSRNHQR